MKPKRSTILARALVLMTIAGVAGYFGFVAPNMQAWRYGRALSQALHGARSVTIEEYSPPQLAGPRDLVHQRITASPQQLEMLRAATGAWKARLPEQSHCFMPHHRVKVVREDGSEFEFEVCFQCHNFQMTGERINAIPDSWLAPLKTFFTTVGMPPMDDYKEKELNHPEGPLQQKEMRTLKEGRLIQP